MTYDGNSLIVSQGQATAAQIDAFMAARGKVLAAQFAPDGKYQAPPAGLGADFIKRCQAWEHTVNHDLAVAQCVKETAGWQAHWARNHNNPAGLGVTGAPGAGEKFDDFYAGVACHIAHLLTYAEGEGDWIVSDRRYPYTPVRWRGTCPKIKDLNGKWAVPGPTYGQDIARIANDLLETEVPMQAEIPGFLWKAEACGEFGYPDGTHGRNGTTIDRLIIHYTAGTDSEDWLIGCHRNSAHFLTEQDGTPRLQMVALSDAAWAAGNKEYNLRGVQLEIERTKEEAKTWPDALIDNVARIAADICKACPSILPDRQHIIGHAEVPPPNDHTDPGGFFPWPHFIDLVQRFVRPTDPPVNPFKDPVTGHYVDTNFQPRFSLSEFNVFVPYDECVKVYGRPIEGSFLQTQADGKVLLVQYFERAVFQQFVNEDGRVEGRLLGAEEFARVYPNGRVPD